MMLRRAGYEKLKTGHFLLVMAAGFVGLAAFSAAFGHSFLAYYGPNWALMLAVYLALKGEYWQAMLGAFIIGLMQDALAGSYIGLSSLALTVVVSLLFLFKRRIYCLSPVTMALLTAAGQWAAFIFVLVPVLTLTGRPLALQLLWPMLLCSSLFSGFLMPILYKVFNLIAVNGEAGK